MQDAGSKVGGRARSTRLKRRAEFLRVGDGKRWHGTAVTIQTEARDTTSQDDGAPRFGFTLTKKVGNAVVRNRARRRLREAVRLAADLPARYGHDYVLVGRLAAVRLPFAALGAELARGIEAVHLRGKSRDGRKVKSSDTVAQDKSGATVEASGRGSPPGPRPTGTELKS